MFKFGTTLSSGELLRILFSLQTLKIGQRKPFSQQCLPHIQTILIGDKASWLKPHFTLFYNTIFVKENFNNLEKFCNDIVITQLNSTTNIPYKFERGTKDGFAPQTFLEYLLWS
ncbi:hypothetical protein Glove_132g20 [Diversispora epigaea]|uniref:Uncharacterized protein n=1 Tax=Diversispora epigaea TaxID=1348612 RepID=A0A397J6E7_9GLOM|nr:hypothetical protein Glove_132g20 [Diversispora epigaea]